MNKRHLLMRLAATAALLLILVVNVPVAAATDVGGPVFSDTT